MILTSKDDNLERVKEWLAKDEEKVFIILPRELEDGTVRMFETVRLETAVEYGHKKDERWARVDLSTRSCLAEESNVGRHLTYSYYPVE